VSTAERHHQPQARRQSRITDPSSGEDRWICRQFFEKISLASPPSPHLATQKQPFESTSKLTLTRRSRGRIRTPGSARTRRVMVATRSVCRISRRRGMGTRKPLLRRRAPGCQMLQRRERSHFAATGRQPMMGLERTTFCMASASDARTQPFSSVRSNRLFDRVMSRGAPNGAPVSGVESAPRRGSYEPVSRIDAWRDARPPVAAGSPADGGGRSGSDLDLPLPGLPAADRRRVRHAGAPASGSRADRRSLHRVHAHLRLRRGPHLSLLPRLRRDGLPDDCGLAWIAVPIGAFADPFFPQPTVSVWESRKYLWLSLPRRDGARARLLIRGRRRAIEQTGLPVEPIAGNPLT
jgi:hypothetical protein